MYLELRNWILIYGQFMGLMWEKYKIQGKLPELEYAIQLTNILTEVSFLICFILCLKFCGLSLNKAG